MSSRVAFGVFIAAAALAGCAGPERWPSPGSTPTAGPALKAAAAPATKVVRVYVPRAVRCVPEELGPPPSYPDTEAALRDAGGAADRYQLLAAGRILREQRLQRLEEIVKKCRAASR